QHRVDTDEVVCLQNLCQACSSKASCNPKSRACKGSIHILSYKRKIKSIDDGLELNIGILVDSSLSFLEHFHPTSAKNFGNFNTRHINTLVFPRVLIVYVSVASLIPK